MNKKLVGLIVIIILLAVIAVVLLWPIEGPNPIGEGVLLATNKAVYNVDETIVVTVKNNLDRPIWFREPTTNCWPSMEMLGKQNGDWVRVPLLPMAPPSEGWDCTTVTNKLEPGDSVNIEYQPTLWHDRNLLNFSKYKLGIGYAISEGAMETTPAYSNEFTISVT